MRSAPGPLERFTTWHSARSARSKAPDPYSPLVLEGLALEMVALSARGTAPTAEPPVSRWLEEVRVLLHAAVEHGDRVPALSSLGAATHRHPVYVARAFRTRFGCTIGAYVRRLRVERARRELAEGSRLAEAAARAGFADQSHFSKVFHRHVGVTPAEFRRRSAG